MFLIYPFRMIKSHVQKVAKSVGITTAYQLQKALEVSPSVAASLWKDDFELISKTSLERLCRALDTTPAQLITFHRTTSAKATKAN
jgi:DNA-binding Xre family transcriptional regulator